LLSGNCPSKRLDLPVSDRLKKKKNLGGRWDRRATTGHKKSNHGHKKKQTYGKEKT